MTIGDRILKAVLAVVLLVAFSLPISIAGIMVRMDQVITSGLVAVLLVLQVVLIACGLWFGKQQGYIRFDKIWWSASAWRMAAIGLVAIVAISYLGSVWLTQSGQENTVNQELIEQISSQVPAIFMFLAVVVNAPLWEEIIFRGLIPDVFNGRFILAGHALGTVSFALMHGPTNLPSWLVYGGMGLVIAIVRYKSDRLEYAILTHGLNNMIAFVLMMLTVS